MFVRAVDRSYSYTCVRSSVLGMAWQQTRQEVPRLYVSARRASKLGINSRRRILKIPTQICDHRPRFTTSPSLPKHTVTRSLSSPGNTMVQYVITPWRNRQELLDARAKLYATQNEQSRLERSRIEGEKAHAVAKVAVWVQRGNCPHLVESTAILTSAWLNDVPGNSVYCVRAAYAAAFCR